MKTVYAITYGVLASIVVGLIAPLINIPWWVLTGVGFGLGFNVGIYVFTRNQACVARTDQPTAPHGLWQEEIDTVNEEFKGDEIEIVKFYSYTYSLFTAKVIISGSQQHPVTISKDKDDGKITWYGHDRLLTQDSYNKAEEALIRLKGLILSK